MKRIFFLGATSAIAISVFGQSTTPNPDVQEPPMFGIKLARGLTPAGNAQITPVLTYQGYIIDTSSTAPDDQSTTILAEICRQITDGNITPDPLGRGYYPVYLDVPKPSNSLHCSYHSSGTCGGKVVNFASIWNLDGNRCGDPLDTLTGHCQGLAALANVSGHELSEARVNGAWRDSQNFENADKCGSPSVFNVPFVTFSKGANGRSTGIGRTLPTPIGQATRTVRARRAVSTDTKGAG